TDGVTPDATPAEWSWVVDVTPPTTQIVGKPPQLTSNATAMFKFSADEPTLHFQYQLDGGSWTCCTDTLNLTNLSVMKHTILVRAVDKAGNVGPTVSYSWTVTGELDTLIVVCPPPGTQCSPAPMPPPYSNSPDSHFEVIASQSPVTFECSW